MSTVLTIATMVGAIATVAGLILRYWWSNQKKKKEVLNAAQTHVDNGDTSGIVADIDQLNRL